MLSKTVTSLFVLSLVAVAGCSKEETVSSANIKTKGIAALLEANSENGTSTKMMADLRVGGDESNTHVILDNGDAISCTAGGETKTLQAESEGVYIATFNTAAADTEFKVSLERPDDENAPNSVGTLPAPFTIGALPTNSPSRANDSFDITWDPSSSGDSMTIRIEGSCIFDEKIDVAGDPGTYTVAPGALDSTGGSNPEACDLTVYIARDRAGTADPAFDNESFFKMRQTRKATFTSAP